MKKVWSRTVSDVSSDLQKVESQVQAAVKSELVRNEFCSTLEKTNEGQKTRISQLIERCEQLRDALDAAHTHLQNYVSRQ